MIKSLLLPAITAMLITGCFETSHDFKIRFGDIKGLQKDNPVYFEETVIGDVEKVEYTDSGFFLVSVSVKKEFASATTETSRFYIDTEPRKTEHMSIRVVQLEKGGNIIEEGTVVEGHTKYAVMYDQFTSQLGKKFSILESGINEFIAELKAFSENEQIREIERQLNGIIAELGNMSIEMKNKLEKEILPLLRKKIEELRKSLEKTGKEKELQRVDQQLEVITDRLRA